MKRLSIVIYHHSMVITMTILFNNTELHQYHGLAVNYHGLKFYNIAPHCWRSDILSTCRFTGATNVVMLSVVPSFYLPTKRNKNYFLRRGVRYQMAYDLKQVLAEFSTLSLPVLLHRNIKERHMHTASSRVENSAQVCLLFQNTQHEGTQYDTQLKKLALCCCAESCFF
jgi:hypothetical protein